MIELFNIPNYKIDTAEFSHLLHGGIVEKLEQNFAEYVGAKYACTANSASSLLFLALKQYENKIINIPSTIPVVVPNVITNTNNKILFYNDTEWVGNCYHLHDNIFDSAQEVTRNQYKELENDDAIVIFSFYPTKPVGGCDGGIVVSNNKKHIEYFKIMTMNGTKFDEESWSREQVAPGYKMHCNSIQAYIANENLKKLDSKNSILDQIRTVYNAALGYNNKSRHLYRIKVDNNIEFLHKMKKVGIQCGIHYKHCHDNPIYNNIEMGIGSLNRSATESETTISLPFHEKLSLSDIKKVIHHAMANSRE